MSCTSSPVLVPPVGHTTAAMSPPVWVWIPTIPALPWAGASCHPWVLPQVLPQFDAHGLWFSSHCDRSPQRLCSQNIKCNLHRTKALQGESKPPTPEIRKRCNVPTVLLSTGRSLCLLCYLTPSKEQFLGKKIVRELPISSASLLGFHFREGRNLKWL